MAGLREVKPVIINQTISVINTEETLTLPNNLVDFTLRLRNSSHSLKIAVVSGASGTTYITLDSTMPAISGEDLFMSNQTLYIQSPDLATVELLAYR